MATQTDSFVKMYEKIARRKVDKKTLKNEMKLSMLQGKMLGDLVKSLAFHEFVDGKWKMTRQLERGNRFLEQRTQYLFEVKFLEGKRFRQYMTYIELGNEEERQTYLDDKYLEYRESVIKSKAAMRRISDPMGFNLALSSDERVGDYEDFKKRFTIVCQGIQGSLTKNRLTFYS